ncbi:hypothetical protein LOAG_17399, partial [Loa loa]
GTNSEKTCINPKNTEDYKSKIEKIVLVDELEIPRGLWKLGRIMELKKIRGGMALIVLVEILNGKFINRPINMVYLLEINDKENSKIQSITLKNRWRKSINKNLQPYELGVS